jgi:hypothetical protein
MRLKQPRFLTFIIAVALAGGGIVSTQRHVYYVSHHSFWFVVAGFAVLALGNLVEGL